MACVLLGFADGAVVARRMCCLAFLDLLQQWDMASRHCKHMHFSSRSVFQIQEGVKA